MWFYKIMRAFFGHVQMELTSWKHFKVTHVHYVYYILHVSSILSVQFIRWWYSHGLNDGKEEVCQYAYSISYLYMWTNIYNLQS